MACAVPPCVQMKAAHLGLRGRRWLSDLPATIARLERRWGVVVGDAAPGGSAAFVAHVTRGDGTGAVLKLPLPDRDLTAEADVLRRAGGRGYVRVLAFEADCGAMLLEELGPALDASGLEPERQLDVLAEILALAWEVRPRAGATLPTDKALALGRYVEGAYQRLADPCPKDVIRAALLCAERRSQGFDPSAAVLVHGDPHAANALRVPAPRTGAPCGFVLVDPEPFVGDRQYDLGVALRGWCPEVLAAPDPIGLTERYAARLAAPTASDARAVWQWAYLERVSTGLYCLEVGMAAVGLRFLQAAARLAEAV